MSDCDTEQAGDDEPRWASMMACAQRGDESTYRQLLRELATAIERYIRSRIGHHHFVEDCVQECLVAIHQGRHSYDPRRRFRPWMFAIVRHKMIDALRVHTRTQQAETVEQDGAGAEASVAGTEEEIAGGGILADLSPQHREVITLTKIVGLSTAETAARLSISEGAVKVRVHRALSRLKRLLEAEAV